MKHKTLNFSLKFIMFMVFLMMIGAFEQKEFVGFMILGLVFIILIVILFFTKLF